MQSVEQHRSEFPRLSNYFYFNFGGQGPLPQSAFSAITETYQQLDSRGCFSVSTNDWIKQEVLELRKSLAELLKVSAANMVITENVTAGCNIALWGIDWKAGDRILLSDCEHPGVIATAQEIARRFQVELAFCPIRETLNHGDPVAVVEEHLTSKTRLLIISHLLWNTGAVLPLAEISRLCHERPQPVQVLVDAAQSVGSLPLDLNKIAVDYYAFTGHKWLCGPAGVGGLYIRPEIFEQLRPTFIGWRGINQDHAGNPISWKHNGERFEVATSAFPQYQGLRAAITFHQCFGSQEERYQQICQQSQYLWQQLTKLERVDCLKKTPPAAGLVSFRVNSKISHKVFVEKLESRGFLLRTLASVDCIRACTHYFTLKSEIDALVEAIDKLSH